MAGINKTLSINATRIPKEINKPISRTRGKTWNKRLKKLIIVVRPARKIGTPNLRMVLRKILPRVASGSNIENS